VGVAPLVAIGECMLELARSGGGGQFGEGWRLGYAGDSFNTALYLRRLGQAVAYFTAVGVDPFSEQLLAAWTAEGLDLSMVLRDPTRLPGLYAIRTDAAGERSFSYWRSQSAARRLWLLPGIETALAAARATPLLYLSGITLSLFEAPERRQLCELAGEVRKRGGQVAFDPNYRPAGWPDRKTAGDAIEAMAAHVSIALPTLEDEQRLWGDGSPSQSAARWRQWGASEVLVKMGAAGCLVHTATLSQQVPATVPPRVVDTTGAGDAFNAGYLAARRNGQSIEAAAHAGHRLAGIVIQYPGAIVPSDIRLQ
jgi:2-dehydro-3-deoxygluconokinase